MLLLPKEGITQLLVLYIYDTFSKEARARRPRATLHGWTIEKKTSSSAPWHLVSLVCFPLSRSSIKKRTDAIYAAEAAI